MAIKENTLDELQFGCSNIQTDAARCVVRLRTSMWHDRRGAYLRQDLVFLRKQSTGYQILEEDLGAIGAAEVLPRIVNLADCEDGIYQVVTCNEHRDWESGHVADYDYRLIPVEN